MWPEAQASNEAAWAASVAAATKRQLDTSYYDFHSLSWLLSISLERGQRHSAEEQLARARDALTRSHDADRMPLVSRSLLGAALAAGAIDREARATTTRS